MPRTINISGANRPVIKQWVNISGGWREVAKEWISIVDPLLGQQWREVDEYIPPQILVPSPSFYRTDTRLVGDMDLRISWQTSNDPARALWRVSASVYSTWFSGGTSAMQNVGYADLVVPQHLRGGQFTAEISYVNSRGAGFSTYLYYYD